MIHTVCNTSARAHLEAPHAGRFVPALGRTCGGRTRESPIRARLVARACRPREPPRMSPFGVGGRGGRTLKPPSLPVGPSSSTPGTTRRADQPVMRSSRPHSSALAAPRISPIRGRVGEKREAAPHVHTEGRPTPTPCTMGTLDARAPRSGEVRLPLRVGRASARRARGTKNGRDPRLARCGAPARAPALHTRTPLTRTSRIERAHERERTGAFQAYRRARLDEADSGAACASRNVQKRVGNAQMVVRPPGGGRFGATGVAPRIFDRIRCLAVFVRSEKKKNRNKSWKHSIENLERMV